MNASIKSTAPSIEHLLQMQAAAEAQRRADSSHPATQPVAGNPRTAFARPSGVAPTNASHPATQPVASNPRTAFARPSVEPTEKPEPAVPDEPGPKWEPDSEQLALLQKEIRVGAYHIRPPAGFVLQARSAKGNYRWGSAKGMFMVNISDRTEAGFHPPIITVPGHQPSPPSQLVFIGASKEIGTIDQIPFVRAFQERGLKRIYAAYDGDQLIVISYTANHPADAAACDAAAQTFRKTRWN